jgi:hypothetical protein
VHGPATHVCNMTHDGWAFICRARPPHAPLMPVMQQFRPAAQSVFEAQLAPAPCFATVAVAVAVSVEAGTSGVLEVVGAIVTVDVD